MQLLHYNTFTYLSDYKNLTIGNFVSQKTHQLSHSLTVKRGTILVTSFIEKSGRGYKNNFYIKKFLANFKVKSEWKLLLQ